jgi:polyhydroxyalkanoate synthesis regulator phasin
MAEGRYEQGDVGLIERAFLMGIGAAMLAKDRVQELADDLVERGKMTRDEAGTFVNRMYAEADDARTSMQQTVATEVERMMRGMGVATSRDLDQIREELTEIKEMIVAQRPMGMAEDDWTPGQ